MALFDNYILTKGLTKEIGLNDFWNLQNMQAQKDAQDAARQQDAQQKRNSLLSRVGQLKLTDIHPSSVSAYEAEASPLMEGILKQAAKDGYESYEVSRLMTELQKVNQKYSAQKRQFESIQKQDINNLTQPYRELATGLNRGVDYRTLSSDILNKYGQNPYYNLGSDQEFPFQTGGAYDLHPYNQELKNIQDRLSGNLWAKKNIGSTIVGTNRRDNFQNYIPLTKREAKRTSGYINETETPSLENYAREIVTNNFIDLRERGSSELPQKVNSYIDSLLVRKDKAVLLDSDLDALHAIESIKEQTGITDPVVLSNYLKRYIPNNPDLEAVFVAPILERDVLNDLNIRKTGYQEGNISSSGGAKKSGNEAGYFTTISSNYRSAQMAANNSSNPVQAVDNYFSALIPDKGQSDYSVLFSKSNKYDPLVSHQMQPSQQMLNYFNGKSANEKSFDYIKLSGSNELKRPTGNNEYKQSLASVSTILKTSDGREITASMVKKDPRILKRAVPYFMITFDLYQDNGSGISKSNKYIGVGRRDIAYNDARRIADLDSSEKGFTESYIGTPEQYVQPSNSDIGSLFID